MLGQKYKQNHRVERRTEQKKKEKYKPVPEVGGDRKGTQNFSGGNVRIKTRMVKKKDTGNAMVNRVKTTAIVTEG